MARKTVLAIGAHFDDCVFGVGGTLLNAVARGDRVVVLTLVGHPSFFNVDARATAGIIGNLVRIAAGHGVEMRFLDHASQQFDLGIKTRQDVGRVVCEVRADLGLMMWPHDTHTDHEVASSLGKVALLHAKRLMNDPVYRPPARGVYMYGNGPTHAVGYTPDTLVDVTPRFGAVMDWLTRSYAARFQRPWRKGVRGGREALSPWIAHKETLLKYYGWMGGVAYAEGLVSAGVAPRDILS